MQIFEKGHIRTRFRNKSGLEPQHCIDYFVPGDEPPPARQAGEERRTGFRITWAPPSGPPFSGSDALQPETERARGVISISVANPGCLSRIPDLDFFIPAPPGTGSRIRIRKKELKYFSQKMVT
jgi:hypothetical protein